ncbi:MAG TPA: transposase [Myxococcota bacterium]|nr:transposase [Myxococcota bacterium]
MSAPRWDVPVAMNKVEVRLVGQLKRTGKLFGFLREHRREIVSVEFEDELREMYRDNGAGKEALPPAMLAMVVVMQAYTGVSDSEAVERALYDARWQLVLGALGAETRPFSQGALRAFRERLIAHEMDRRLLERTAEFARSSKGFDSKKLPKVLRVAVDSRPLAGAGRVEDSINLLARAGRQLLVCGAMLARLDLDELAKKLKVELLLGSSVKAALDVDWTDEEERSDALRTLLEALDAAERWVRKRFGPEADKSPLVEHLEMLTRLRAQDIDPEPQMEAAQGFATVLPRTASSQSVMLRCDTDERARARLSTDTRRTSLPRLTTTSSWPRPCFRPTARRAKVWMPCGKTLAESFSSRPSENCMSTAPTSKPLWRSRWQPMASRS